MVKKNEPQKIIVPSEPLITIPIGYFRRGKNEVEGQGGFIGDGPLREAPPTIAHRLEEPAPASVEQGALIRELRSKGGKKRARDKNRATWDRYGRGDVLKELKAAFRRNRSIKKAGAVRHLRQELHPACDDKTLGRLFDKWKATEKRIFSKRNENESS
jgi:hypothetical protein